MPYYNKSVREKYPDIINYFETGIKKQNIAHSLLFWGGDVNSQCEIALEIARLLNCKEEGAIDCDCLNCRWIREQSHPAVKIYTRLDFKEAATSSDDEESSSGKKNITVEQAKAIVNELSITSDYHRVYILCDRDEEGNLMPLNQINFPDKTSNALLKTFEEPPQNTTFIILTKDKTDIISTIQSRCQTFFIPSSVKENDDYNLVEDVVQNYWTTERNNVLDFENKLMNRISEHEPILILTQFQNYILATMKTNFENKKLFYRLKEDLKYIEEAKRQILLSKMITQTVCENLSFKLILK